MRISSATLVTDLGYPKPSPLSPFPRQIDGERSFSSIYTFPGYSIMRQRQLHLLQIIRCSRNCNRSFTTSASSFRYLLARSPADNMPPLNPASQVCVTLSCVYPKPACAFSQDDTLPNGMRLHPEGLIRACFLDPREP